MHVSLATHGEFLSALKSAKAVALCAYVLPAGSAVVRALEEAADRGARVVVRLDGSPYFGPASKDAPNPNVTSAAALRAHGAQVSLSEPGDAPVHLKAAVVDGRTFLDDRNWPASGGDTVVASDDSRAARSVGDAIDGRPHSEADLALQKAAALALEAATIRSGQHGHIDVASESFGSGVISDALCERAQAGATVRLEIDARVLSHDAHGRERAALARLIAAGVVVRAVASSEKFAVAGGRASWLGSANATASDGGMLDWGVRSDDTRLAGTLGACRA